MSTEQIEQQEDGARNDPAFEITEVNTATGETIVVIQKGIIGPMANQLIATPNSRKGPGILRKLGHMLSKCGDIQYGKPVEGTDIDPSIVTDQIPQEEEVEETMKG